MLLPENLRIFEFVNADNIAAGLSPFAPESVAFEAGRLMLSRVRGLLNRRQSYSIETTLAGKTHVPMLQEASTNGYSLHMLYVSLKSADLAILRIANPVRQGGHSIPEDVARRRFGRSLNNFFGVYRLLVQSWVFCDNSGGRVRTIATSNAAGEVQVVDRHRLRRIQTYVPQANHVR